MAAWHSAMREGAQDDMDKEACSYSASRSLTLGRSNI